MRLIALIITIFCFTGCTSTHRLTQLDIGAIGLIKKTNVHRSSVRITLHNGLTFKGNHLAISADSIKWYSKPDEAFYYVNPTEVQKITFRSNQIVPTILIGITALMYFGLKSNSPLNDETLGLKPYRNGFYAVMGSLGYLGGWAAQPHIVYRFPSIVPGTLIEGPVEILPYVLDG